MRSIKITISFTSLIPYLILPRELRETTERTPSQLPVTKKCFFLRLLLNQVVLIPKKVDSFPEIVDLSISQQNHPITLKTFKTPKTFSTQNLHIRKFYCNFAPAIPRRGCLHVIGWGSRHG